MSKPYKLVPELVPSTAWYRNLRSELMPQDWNALRRMAYEKAGNCCETCGEPNTRLECHEVWDYNGNTGKQKLIRLKALCPACHEVQHIGLAEMKGRLEQALAHMQKVNGIDRQTAEQIIEESFQVWRRRSRIDWKLDLSALEAIRAGK